MGRNSLAGTTKGKSKSAKYLHENPAARAKKKAYDTNFHKIPARRRYRSELNAANRRAGTYGKMSKMGKDRSHTKSGKLVLESSSTNRARNGKGKNGRRLK